MKRYKIIIRFHYKTGYHKKIYYIDDLSECARIVYISERSHPKADTKAEIYRIVQKELNIKTDFETKLVAFYNYKKHLYKKFSKESKYNKKWRLVNEYIWWK